MKFSTTFIAACISAGAFVQAAAPTKGWAKMGAYPGTDPAKVPSGEIQVEIVDNQLKLTGDLLNMHESCTDGECGIHLHTGTSCEDAAFPIFHHWKTGEDDPWVPTKITADADGKSTVDVAVAADDFPLKEVFGRTIVIHTAQKGAPRYACGQILPENVGTSVHAASITPYPDAVKDTAVGNFYNADKELVGSVQVLTKSETDADVTVTLEGVTGTFDATLYAGDSCETTGEPEIELTEVTSGTAKTGTFATSGLKTADRVVKVTIPAEGEGDATTYCASLTDKNTAQGFVYFYEEDDKLQFAGHGVGLELRSGDQITAGWHVHDGTECATAGGHLMQGETDPWKDLKYTVATPTEGLNVKYGGHTFFSGEVEGANLEFIGGRTVVLHAADGKIRQGCGKLTGEVKSTSGSSVVSISLTAGFAAISAFLFA